MVVLISHYSRRVNRTDGVVLDTLLNEDARVVRSGNDFLNLCVCHSLIILGSFLQDVDHFEVYFNSLRLFFEHGAQLFIYS